MLPTTIQPFTLLSDQDGLPLSGLLLLPQEETVPCGILQVSHGMCEHKERYLDFLRHCTKQGYICLIHDHRGHGESISDTIPLGYFGEDGAEALVADLHQMTEWIQTQSAGAQHGFAHCSLLSAAISRHSGRFDSQWFTLSAAGNDPYAIYFKSSHCASGRYQPQQTH